MALKYPYRKWNGQTRAARAASVKKYSDKLRNAVIELLGGHCIQCGFSDVRALQVDHIHGGGTRERKNGISNSRLLMLDVMKTEGKYQLLCANCNWIKRVVNKEYKYHGISE